MQGGPGGAAGVDARARSVLVPLGAVRPDGGPRAAHAGRGAAPAAARVLGPDLRGRQPAPHASRTSGRRATRRRGRAEGALRRFNNRIRKRYACVKMFVGCARGWSGSSIRGLSPGALVGLTKWDVRAPGGGGCLGQGDLPRSGSTVRRSSPMLAVAALWPQGEAALS